MDAQLTSWQWLVFVQQLARAYDLHNEGMGIVIEG